MPDVIGTPEELLKRFGWADYLVFAGMLAISLGIGIYYGCIGTKQKTTSEFFIGSGKMGVFPVAMSLAASFYSASGLMGVPAEMYRYGTMQFMHIICFIFLVPAVGYLYAPMFHRLRIASSFEYLELRFNVAVRKLASIILIMQMLLYMATAVWAPALALSQVTGMSAYVAVTANFIVCAFYTTLGGFKAVLWTDTFQFVMMLVTMFTVLGKGNSDVGGFTTVLNASLASGRIELFEMDPDPTIRHSFWSVIVGSYFMWLAIFGVNQTQVQRYMSLPSTKDVRKALVICFILTALLDCANYYLGLVIYTRYQHCDPVAAGVIKKVDQLLPLFVMDTLGSFTGLPGLLVAGLYSASLSTVSSGLNSLAAVTLEDFVRPLFPLMSEGRATLVSKGLSLLYGLLAFAIVFLMANLTHIVEAVLSIFGLAGGPLLGVFTLGMYFPWANSIGAFCGLISSVALMFWIGFGAMVLRTQGYLQYVLKPISTEGCALFGINQTLSDVIINTTSIVNNIPIGEILQSTVASSLPPSEPDILAIYKLSYMWYSASGFLLAITIGLMVSGLRGFQDPKKLDPDLVFDIGTTLFWFLPKRYREFLRFCVGDHHEKKVNRELYPLNPPKPSEEATS